MEILASARKGEDGVGVMTELTITVSATTRANLTRLRNKWEAPIHPHAEQEDKGARLASQKGGPGGPRKGQKRNQTPFSASGKKEVEKKENYDKCVKITAEGSQPTEDPASSQEEADTRIILHAKHTGAGVAERLTWSPPTKANWVQSPAGSLPDFCKWESCWTMPLVDGFFGDLPFPPPFHSSGSPYSLYFTLIGSQDPDGLQNCAAPDSKPKDDQEEGYEKEK
ncbi:hypothetical protein PR048_019088 [Dryococelus australis]|uniref:Uncharacterized protein n=1 Tax=Dryococelus australis TaxID=614101 RepID=A0ABQ9H2L1_9NEOP|nr:hypothetical protein PR048_019088 [Dryococelus australis]